MTNKNILEFCLSPDLGGLELFMSNCYKSFSKASACKVIVAPDKKLANYMQKEKPFYLKRNKLFPIIPALRLAHFIDKNEIDIIHFHWTKDIATVILGKTLSKRKPKIIQTRNMTMTRFKSDFYHRWLYENVDIMHAVTYQVKNQIEKFVPSDICPKIKMVYMGTQEQQTDETTIEKLKINYKIDKNDFVVGIIGRIEEGKGQYLVIEAIAKLKKENINIKALIIGHTMEQAYLETLQEQIKNDDIKDNIIFTSFTTKVNEHIKLCDATILATKKETFGLVVIESMINKVPVIGTNCGGPLEIIDDGKTGLLFERNSDDLAKKIKSIYEDSVYQRNLAQAGYEKAKEMFDSDIQMNKLKVILENL